MGLVATNRGLGRRWVYCSRGLRIGVVHLVQKMRIKAPKLIEGVHYTRLSVKEGHGKYRFKTLVPITYQVLGLSPKFRTRSFLVAYKEWLCVTSDTITIAAGYAWNGNSWKKGSRVFGKDVWLGTPDFEQTIAASLVHDAIYQFSDLLDIPFTREQSDLFYRDICRQNDFVLAPVYYGALWACSKSAWGQKQPDQSVVISGEPTKIPICGSTY